MAISHGHTDFVRRVIAHFSLDANVLRFEGDGDCDWRFFVKTPSMVSLFADELQWLTKEHLLSDLVETPTLLLALSLTESADSWRTFQRLGVTQLDVLDASKRDVGSFQLNQRAIDACATVFGAELGRTVLAQAKKARGQEAE